MLESKERWDWASKCVPSAETLHPLGFASHVKKCNGTRRTYNILTRSKACIICGTSMNREPIQSHEAACSAKREDLKPAEPVKRRITSKRPPGPDYDGVSNNATTKDEMTKKRQKRGDTMAKRDTVVREKKTAAPDGRTFTCKYCGDSFSAEKHVWSCEKAPWGEWAKGVRWRKELRNKRFTDEERETWQHKCAHCEVDFPCKSGLTRHTRECVKRRTRDGLQPRPVRSPALDLHTPVCSLAALCTHHL